MSGLELLPSLDPTPNPGPAWLFHGLLVLTFFLHVLFMNLTLGGTLMAALAQLGSRGRAGDPRTVLAARMSAVNGYGIAFTITTGIAPLLFVQVLYQQTFYPATLLVGTVWLGLLGLLVFGYYFAYLYKFRGAPAKGSGGTVWLVAAAVLFLGIAMIQVSVNLIHSQPESWTEVAASGWAVLADPTWAVRLLHFVLGAVALSAAVVTWWAVRRARQGEEPELNEGIARHAWKWALGAIFLQVFDGFLFLQLLPERVLGGLFSDPWRAIPLDLAVLLGLGLLLMVARVRNPVAAPAAVTGVLALSGTILAVMAITRHQVRVLYLEPVSSRFEAASAPQWLNFALFAGLLVVALGTVAWMVRAVVRHPAAGEEAA
ncbi:MAG TPA: hypothetical protein VF150_08350 [Thermoanaerobaculia bacterium]